MTEPRVSVVVAAYDAERFIREAVSSLLMQTMPRTEVIVVDDASRDSTAALVAGLFGDRVRLIRLPENGGQSRAFNVAIVSSRGEYVALLGADDVAAPTRLATQWGFLEEHPEAVGVGSDYESIDAAGRVLGSVRLAHVPVAIAWGLITGNPIAAPTMMIRKKALESVGLFDEGLRFAEDLDLWGRLAAAGPIGHVRQPLVRYRQHTGSLTHGVDECDRVATVSAVHARNAERLTGVRLTVEQIMMVRGDRSARSRVEALETCVAFGDALRGFVMRQRLSPRDRRQICRLWWGGIARVSRSSPAHAAEVRQTGRRIMTRVFPEWPTNPRLLVAMARMD